MGARGGGGRPAVRAILAARRAKATDHEQQRIQTKAIAVSPVLSAMRDVVVPPGGPESQGIVMSDEHSIRVVFCRIFANSDYVLRFRLLDRPSPGFWPRDVMMKC
jgi:hypothetical protein